MVLVETTTRVLLRSAKAAAGSRYAMLLPTPVPASTTRLLPSSKARATARSICSCSTRCSNFGAISESAPPGPTSAAAISSGSCGKESFASDAGIGTPPSGAAAGCAARARLCPRRRGPTCANCLALPAPPRLRSEVVTAASWRCGPERASSVTTPGSDSTAMSTSRSNTRWVATASSSARWAFHDGTPRARASMLSE